MNDGGSGAPAWVTIVVEFVKGLPDLWRAISESVTKRADSRMRSQYDPAAMGMHRLFARMHSEVAPYVGKTRTLGTREYHRRLQEYLGLFAQLIQRPKERVRAGLFLAHPPRHSLRLAVGPDHELDDAREFPFRRSSLAVQCFNDTHDHQCGMIHTANVWKHPKADRTRIPGNHNKYRAVCVVGVAIDGDRVGVLSVDASKAREWTPDEQELIRLFASCLSSWMAIAGDLAAEEIGGSVRRYDRALAPQADTTRPLPPAPADEAPDRNSARPDRR